MAFDGSGTFNPLSPEYPAVAGTVIYADDWNAIVADIAAGLSICLTTDGQSVMQGTLDMDDETLLDAILENARVNLNPDVLSNDTSVASTAWVRANFLGPVYSAGLALYMFENC